MYLSEQISEKWDGVIKHQDLPEIKDPYKRDVTLRLLENQEQFLKEAAPTNQTGGNIDNWDPILISLVRRSMPQMIAYDVAGVQPMTGPTGLIFAMKSKYENQGGTESFGATGTGADESDTDFSGRNAAGANGSANAHVTTDGTNNPFDGTWTYGTGMTTAQAEALGDAANNHFAEMAFSIDKTSVTAKSRALKAEYSTELAQDLKAIHGLDAETELANILSTEILQEINREVIRTIYTVAKPGAQTNVTTAGTFDLDTDSNGRWSVEKFKGLMFQIERDRNEIGHTTRRGKGNFMICSADVASAMSMAGVLDYNPAIQNDLSSDVAGNSFAGVLNGKYNVYIDPYFQNPGATAAGYEYYTIGYKGTSAYDAGIFYCPYVPLQMVRAMGEETFQPKIGFKTRYGIQQNPFVSTSAGAGSEDANVYYRKVKVTNLM